MKPEAIHTNKGELTIPEILDHLMFSSYIVQREVLSVDRLKPFFDVDKLEPIYQEQKNNLQ